MNPLKVYIEVAIRNLIVRESQKNLNSNFNLTYFILTTKVNKCCKNENNHKHTLFFSFKCES